MKYNLVDTPVKDPHRAHPVAAMWRPTVQNINDAIVEDDYDFRRRDMRIVLPSLKLIAHLRASIAAYGETLISLPSDTWETSLSQWMGSYWEVLVDLWTIEAGRSDLVLALRILEVTDIDFQVEIQSIYVP